MKTILTYGKCFPSAKILRDALQEISGERIRVTKNPNKVKDLILRFGGTLPLPRGVQDVEVNPVKFIQISAGKKSFSDLLLSENFHTPSFKKSTPENFPVVIRKVMDGYRGQGIVVVDSMEEFEREWRQQYWWTEFVPTTYEMRLHFVQNKIIRAFIKRWNGDGGEPQFPIRNMHRGYHFSLVDLQTAKRENRYSKLFNFEERISEFLMKKLGAKFFCLDVGYSKQRQDYFVFESGSAPGLNENTAREYAQHLAPLIL